MPTAEEATVLFLFNNSRRYQLFCRYLTHYQLSDRLLWSMFLSNSVFLTVCHGFCNTRGYFLDMRARHILWLLFRTGGYE